jgi:FkbM family methyltransferase
MSMVSRPRRVALTAQELGCLSDWQSRRRLLKLRLEQRRHGDLSSPAADSAVPLNVKALAGGPLLVRPRASDIDMLWDTYVANWNLPPPEMRENPRRIVELGTNIGAGLAGLAVRYPEARVLGVEPDPENAALARRNLERFGDRARVLELAIWNRDAELVVERTRREWGLVVRPRHDDDPPEWPTVLARSVGSVLAEFDPEEPIDFLFMDIEGTEQRILQADDTAWAQRVRCIRVECEHQYDADVPACQDTLARMGFDVRVEPFSWGSFVFGVRPDSMPSPHSRTAASSSSRPA